MPSNWECESCHLLFITGKHYYYDLRSSCVAQTPLVCRFCGTIHAIEDSITSAPREQTDNRRRAIDQPNEQLTVRFLAQPEPLFLDLAAHERATNSDSIIDEFVLGIPKLRDWIECRALSYEFSKNEARAISIVDGCTEILSTEDLPCHTCGESTSLVATWLAQQECPRCKGLIKCKTTWIT